MLRVLLMSARIDPDGVAALSAAIAPLDTPALRDAYRAGDFPRADAVRDLDKRYRWDLFWSARAWSLVPDGVNDAHIDTALRAIVPTLKGS